MKSVIVTSGEPAGIGPDIALALAHTAFDAGVVVAGDIHLLRRRAAQLGIAVSLDDADGAPRRHAGDGRLAVRHVALKAPATDGRLDSRNAEYVLEMIDGAVDGCLAGRYSALATCPVSKAAVIRAGESLKIPVAMCGEMAGDRRFVRLLLAMGLTEFSVQPNELLEVKSVIMGSDLAALKRKYRRITASREPRRIAEMVG